MKAKKITAVIVTLCTMLGGIGANAATSTLNGKEISRYSVDLTQNTGFVDSADTPRLVYNESTGKYDVANNTSTDTLVLNNFAAQDAFKITVTGLRRTSNWKTSNIGVGFLLNSGNQGMFVTLSGTTIKLANFWSTTYLDGYECDLSQYNGDIVLGGDWAENNDYLDLEVYVAPDYLIPAANKRGGTIVVYAAVRDNTNPLEYLVPRTKVLSASLETINANTERTNVALYCANACGCELDSFVVEDLPYQLIDSVITKSDGTVVSSTNELTAGDTVDITARIINENGALPAGIFAAYGPENFLNLYFADAVKNTETVNTYTIDDFVVPEGAADIDAFFWDSIETMKPYMNKQDILKSETVTATVNISVE